MSSSPGVFVRVNGEMIKSGVYDNKIVSIVGRMTKSMNDIVEIECSDGISVPIRVDEGFQFKANQIVEIMGFLDNASVPIQVS